MGLNSETSELISAFKVQGTPVFNTEGESLGSLDDVMIDKRSGRVAYAVMSFGGFLGIGESYHPLPWALLKYDTRQGGYVIGLSKAVLMDAPSYERADAPDWSDLAYEKRIHDYYKTDRRWISAMP